MGRTLRFSFPLLLVLAALALVSPDAHPFTAAALHATQRQREEPTRKRGRLPLTGRLRESPSGGGGGRGWPACDPQAQQWSGYFDIPGKKADKHYFYWAFGPRRETPGGARTSAASTGAGRNTSSTTSSSSSLSAEAAAAASRAPVVLWLTGGPGCSSTLALLSENGACLIDPATGALRHNPWAWNNEATVIFVDQPANVGYSYTDDETEVAHNQDEVAENMYHFLQAFFDRHPELRKRDFFVAAESYGGRYGPAVAHRIWSKNKALRRLHQQQQQQQKKKKEQKRRDNKDGAASTNKNKKSQSRSIRDSDAESRVIRLRGLAVGNGLTSALQQYRHYPTMAYDYCEQRLGSPCVGAASYAKMAMHVPYCEHLIRACLRHGNPGFPRLGGNSGSDDDPATRASIQASQAAWAADILASRALAETEEQTEEDRDCGAAALVCNAIPDPYGDTGLNPYDIRQNCSVPGLCYDFTQMELFLNRRDVQAALRGGDGDNHSGSPEPLVWQSCNMDVYAKFANDWFKDFNGTIADLLDGGNYVSGSGSGSSGVGGVGGLRRPRERDNAEVVTTAAAAEKVTQKKTKKKNKTIAASGSRSNKAATTEAGFANYDEDLSAADDLTAPDDDAAAGKIRVMIYVGDMDFICNWIGNKAWVSALDWSGRERFARAFDVPFYIDQEPVYYDNTTRTTARGSGSSGSNSVSSNDNSKSKKLRWEDYGYGRPAGLIRSVANAHSPFHLSFVQVFDAGHMVPMDQPAAASTLLHHFLFNEPFPNM